METNLYEENLIETRRILELAAVRMAAERRTSDDLREILMAQNAFLDQTLEVGFAVEEDLLFHLKVVAASKNDVLKSLFIKIIPDLIDLLNKTVELEGKNYFKTIHEHENIIEHITHQNADAAAESMKGHLS